MLLNKGRVILRPKEKSIREKQEKKLKINEMSWFFYKLKKIDKSIAKLVPKDQNIRNENEEIIIDTNEIQRVIRAYIHILPNWKTLKKSMNFKIHVLPKLSIEQTTNLNKTRLK